MSANDIISKLKKYHRRLNGSTVEYDLTPYKDSLNEIEQLRSVFEIKSNPQLQRYSKKLMAQARIEKALDGLLVEAFALVGEAIWRVLKMRPFEVQIIGALVMHQGKLAEMQTGEGKTLSAVFPAYLNALSGEGTHVLTFNDYLARRDAAWMGPVYEFLGLGVGFVQEGMGLKKRQKAYKADITYLTAKEAGFDFLRDSLCNDPADIVQRPFHFGIVDEADSILLDEARVPLIIAGNAEETVADACRIAKVARQLEIEADYRFDAHARNFHLTENGLDRAAGLLNCGNLWAEENFGLLTRLNCAIHAETLLRRDIDYIVRDGGIELVDEFTGRVADRRRWPDGLQAAIEAKENIRIQSKGKILNSITLQHFLGLYPKLSGMTATAHTSENEFAGFYGLKIVVIPPNRPPIRKDHKDRIFKNQDSKNKALIEKIVAVHKTRRPILVGTGSVAASTRLADTLQKQGVVCAVLNAKRDALEAKIVADAGKLGAVTISTNMAGRGTDIRLGGADENERKQVLALGGLYVIGTNKHESQRTDNQLRGRSGRQGDPGSSLFMVSLEDDLFARYRLKELIASACLGQDASREVDDHIVRREINRVQRIVAGQNFEIKKTLAAYSDLVEKQRQVIFEERSRILGGDAAQLFFEQHSPEHFAQLATRIKRQQLNVACREIGLFHLDRIWSRHLAHIADIREGVHLVRLAGEKPVLEFQRLAIGAFASLRQRLDADMLRSFTALEIRNNRLDLAGAGLIGPSSTWTYLINDNPFEEMLGVQIVGSTGLQVGAGVLWPLLMIYSLVKKLRQKANAKL
jgi:preprotein translocase subunit SecA